MNINGVDIAALYRAGLSVREVACRAGLSETTTRRRLREAGVKLRQPGIGASPTPAKTCAICGRPLKGHPRCKACGILVGAGHEYHGPTCAACRQPGLTRAQITDSLVQAILLAG